MPPCPKGVCTVCGLATIGHGNLSECLLALKARVEQLEEQLEKYQKKTAAATK